MCSFRFLNEVVPLLCNGYIRGIPFRWDFRKGEYIGMRTLTFLLTLALTLRLMFRLALRLIFGDFALESAKQIVRWWIFTELWDY